MEEALLIIAGLLLVALWYGIKWGAIGVYSLITWPWRVKRQKAEEERRRKQAVEAEERQKAKQERFLKDHAALIHAIHRTLISSGSKVTEMMRVCKTISEDADYENIEPCILLEREILSIVAAFVSANGEVTKSLVGLSTGLLDQILDGYTDEYAERRIQHEAKTPSVVVPPTVMFLAMYDSFQNTAFAAEAAATYVDLIRAVAAMCKSAPVAAKIVESQYVELLRPYLASDSADSRESGRTQHAASRNGCGDCAKYYEALGLKDGATESEVKEAHRVLVQALHPDGWGNKSDLARRVAEEQTKSINAARDHLLSCRFSQSENVPPHTPHQSTSASAAEEESKRRSSPASSSNESKDARTDLSEQDLIDALAPATSTPSFSNDTKAEASRYRLFWIAGILCLAVVICVGIVIAGRTPASEQPDSSISPSSTPVRQAAEPPVREAPAPSQPSPSPSPIDITPSSAQDPTESKRLNTDGLHTLSGANPDFASARNDFERAFQLDSTNVEALNNLGYVYGRLGDYHTAESILLRVLDMSPTRKAAQGNLGAIQAELGKTQEAADRFCQYVRHFDSLEHGKATLTRVFKDANSNVKAAVDITLANCN